MSETSFWQMVKRANAPPPPDHSIIFRLATTTAVFVGILACESVGELSLGLTVAAMVSIALGMLFSYMTRRRPWQWLKILLAISVVAVFGGFVNEILQAAHTGQIASVEIPLAALFTWVQVIHSFDVPARRDLLFSLAAAGALVTIGAAQAQDGNFVAYVGVWLLSTVVALSCSWRSMGGGRGPAPTPLLAGCLVTVLALALGLLVLLPQPRAAQGLTLPVSLAGDLSLGGSGGIVNGSGAEPTEPAKAGTPGGRIGVGGYIGFAGPLQTADRGSLGDQVIMRVRADRPGYFLGETYDVWNGESWLQSAAERQTRVIATGSPFVITPPGSTETSGASGTSVGSVTNDIQTFYVEQPLPNLLFGTADASVVYFDTHSLVVGGDGSIRSTVAITPGTVYTVVSADDEQPTSVLARDNETMTQAMRSSGQIAAALALPHSYPRVSALAHQIVRAAHATTTLEEVQALESWMAAHTEYTTDIPPLQRGQDTVTEFLFVERRGYCEQISTSLAIMLRTLHIPAREAIGYVPGQFNPLSGLYDIQAKDAHAWVEVYFPGYGWQSFDPTADVPLAPPNPGSVLLHDAAHWIAALPWAPIGGAAGAAIIGYGSLDAVRRRRRRPATWAGRAALRLETLGRRGQIPRHPAETLVHYAARLEHRFPGLGLLTSAAAIEHSFYSEGGSGTSSLEAAVEASLAALARDIGRVRWMPKVAGEAVRQLSRRRAVPGRTTSPPPAGGGGA